jgi:hypothetical protein
VEESARQRFTKPFATQNTSNGKCEAHIAQSGHLSKLDDGWPESVEEQGLLLLVLRHYITRQYIKDVLLADEKRSIQTI